MSHVEKGRARQRALFAFLDAYEVATTDQLAQLFWGGTSEHQLRLARSHLLRYLRAPPEKVPRKLLRLPHPLYRNGAYVWTTRQKGTGHTQKVLHHLQLVDFHIAVVGQIARYGARVVPELPWAPGLIPDQTVFWKDAVWAIEHHLNGPFSHGGDYRQFMEEEAFSLCHWWKSGVRMGLLVLTTSGLLDHVRRQLQLANVVSLTCRVATRDSALRNLGTWLKLSDDPPKGE